MRIQLERAMLCNENRSIKSNTKLKSYIDEDEEGAMAFRPRKTLLFKLKDQDIDSLTRRI